MAVGHVRYSSYRTYSCLTRRYHSENGRQRLYVLSLIVRTTAHCNRQQRVVNLTPKLTGAITLWDHWSRDEQRHFLVDVLDKLGLRGVLDLLGVRQTVGSADLFPPPRETLLSCFNAVHWYVKSFRPFYCVS